MNRLNANSSEALKLQEIWVLFLTSGIALIVLGLLLLSFSLTSTLATILQFGLLLAVGAVVQIGSALWAWRWRGFILHLLLGIVYLIVGIFLLDQPHHATAGVTLLVAASLMVTGIFRITLAMTNRVDHGIWVLISGTISLMLGISIWRQWPLSGLWIIGLFMGIELLSCGCDWVWLGLSTRKLNPDSTPLR